MASEKDPPIIGTPGVHIATHLPTFLSRSTPHTWYDYSSLYSGTPSHTITATPGTSTSKRRNAKPKLATEFFTQDNVLTLATLLPSTRPLLSTSTFLKLLNLSPEQTQSLKDKLRDLGGHRGGGEGSAGDGGGTGAEVGKGASRGNAPLPKLKRKIDELRQRELDLARKEAREKKLAAKSREKERKRDIDKSLGLAGARAKGKTPGKGSNLPGAKGNAKKPNSNDCNYNHGGVEIEGGVLLRHPVRPAKFGSGKEEQGKKRRISEMDRILGLGSSTLNAEPTDVHSSPHFIQHHHHQLDDTKLDDSPISQAPGIDALQDEAAIRKANIDMLLGLVCAIEPTQHRSSPSLSSSEGEDEDEEDEEGEKIQDHSNANPTTNDYMTARRRINKDMGRLDPERMGQMDAILGLLSPRKRRVIQKI